MNISITKNVEEANAITHGGKFHADDVMATVILGKAFGNLKVYRTFNVPQNVGNNVIIYDIGFGKYDHHQSGGNGVRFNNVPYASCGLIWRDFGEEIVRNTCNPRMVWNIIDRELIQGIDATDNGEMPNVDYYCHSMSVTSIISSFNPNWDEELDFDGGFLKAIEFAETIFDNTMSYADSKARAKEYIEKAIENSKDHIMVLDRYLPWQGYVLSSINEKAKDIWFVVYPSNRGGYNFQGVPVTFNSFNQRKNIPKEWCGIREDKLRSVTKVATAKFCHAAGFIGGAMTFEDTMKLAQMAVKA